MHETVKTYIRDTYKNITRSQHKYSMCQFICGTSLFLLSLDDDFMFFSVRLLLVLCGHSVFSSPPQRPMTFDFEGFSIPDCIHYIDFPILILEKEPVFSLLDVQC